MLGIILVILLIILLVGGLPHWIAAVMVLISVTSLVHGQVAVQTLLMATTPASVTPPPPGLPFQVAAVNAARPSDPWSQVVHYDYSTSFYSNPSTWLKCHDGSSPVGPTWYASGNYPPDSCNLMGQAVDPVTGKLGLDLHWGSANWQSACAGQAPSVWEMQSMRPDGTGLTVPRNYYSETALRIDRELPAGTLGNGHEISTWWNYSSNYDTPGPLPACSGGNCALENDDSNMFLSKYCDGSGGDFTSPLWQSIEWEYSKANGSGFNGGNYQTVYNVSPTPSQYLMSKVHTFGHLKTSDGTSAIWSCYYVDNQLINCVSELGQSNIPDFNPFIGRNMLFYAVGDVNTDMHMYVQYTDVYSCDTWQASECNGPVMASPPSHP